MPVSKVVSTSLFLVLSGCGGGGGDDGPQPVSTAHCSFEPVPATAGAGGTVEAGPLMAGAAEAPLVLPVSSALGGYTARADFLGNTGTVDMRDAEMPGGFNPSLGVESYPRVKALALTAGGEHLVIVKADLIFSDDSLTADVAELLGPEFAGKVIYATTHTHSAPMQWSDDSKLAVGGGRLRDVNRRRLLDTLVAVAGDALAAQVPARLGVFTDTGFDPGDVVTRDRRGEDNLLPGGDRKDDFLALIRVDTTGGDPIAIVPVFGMHGTVLDADNPLHSGDAPGAVDRAMEEQFDQPVVVMYLQGAGGNVSPTGRGSIANPSIADEPYYNFSRAEGAGRSAVAPLMAAWQAAGDAMQDQLAIEVVTRSVPLGPDWRTFTIRDGTLEYAPFDPVRPCDREIWDATGGVISPIDEFNAPHGAGLCGTLDMDAIFPLGQMPGTEELGPYRSCVWVDVASEILGIIMDIQFEAMPVCASTRTTVTAARLGEYLIATVPAEPVTLLADLVRASSPIAPQKTIVVGYAQGHIGYGLPVEDWLQGGYEPSINSWGPLEGEYVVERLAELMPLAMTPEREDAAAGGVDRLASPAIVDDLPPPDPAPLMGTVAATVLPTLYVRGHAVLDQNQPDATVERVSGLARFAWIGEDPITGTPRVALEREVAPGTFETVRRRSGRPVEDGDLLLFWTPDPLKRNGDEPRTHHWVVEWQPVTWWGTPGMDDVEDRAGVPLGRYRFHVEAQTYSVDSDAFEVVPGPIEVSATVTGDQVTATARYHAPDGWRLIDNDALSNQPVPVRRGPVTVELGYSDGTSDTFAGTAIDTNGIATVTARAGATVTSVRVTDRFGNTGTGAP